jgi:hypothetical protein
LKKTTIIPQKITGDLGISEIKIAGDFDFLKLSICKSEKKAVILFFHNLTEQVNTHRSH